MTVMGSSSSADGVSSPKRKSIKRPRVDSGMDDGMEEQKATSDVEMRPRTSARRKGAKKAKDAKVHGESEGEDNQAEGE
jgi:hypothetical protein